MTATKTTTVEIGTWEIGKIGVLEKRTKNGKIESITLRLAGEEKPQVLGPDGAREVALTLMDALRISFHPDKFEWHTPPCPHHVPCADPNGCQRKVLRAK